MFIFWLVMQIPIVVLTLGVWYVFYQTIHPKEKIQALPWVVLGLTYLMTAMMHFAQWSTLGIWLFFLVGHGLSLWQIFDLRWYELLKVLPTVFIIRLVAVGIANATVYQMGSSPYGALWVMVVSLYFLLILGILLLEWQRRLEKSGASAQAVYEQILQDKQDELQLWRHDLKNHLSCIRGMLELNDYQGALEYMKTMDTQLQATTIPKLTDNVIANVLLAEKKQQAEADGIEFEFYSDGVSLAFVNNADLCAILGNLLDNALEGSRQSVDKTIQVDIYELPSQEIKLTVVNSSDQVPQMADKQLRTTKLDGQGHGYGLRSVEKAAKCYDGRLLVGYDEMEHSFKAVVTLKQPKQPTISPLPNTMEVQG